MTMNAQTTPKTPAATTAPAKPAKLRLERVFNATPERLWTYWTDPKKYAKWLNPAPIDLVIQEFDVREGGRIRFDMPQPDGNRNPQEGVFHVLDPPRRLVSGNDDKSFLLEVEFQPVGANQTRMVVNVTGVPSEYHQAATQGWGAGLDKLARLLEGGEGKPSPTASKARLIGAERATGRVTKDRYVEVERWFAAPPEKVYAAWGDPKMLPKFFWPVGTGRVDKLEFRPGGELRMAHTTQPWTAIWSFIELVPGRKIVVRDVWPDGSGVSAVGTMEFIPERGGTRVKVRHGPFPTTGPYQPEGAVQGFGMVTDRLAEQVEVPGPGEGFQLVRHLNAPPKKVWEMWTTKEGLAKWWAVSAKDMGYAFRVEKLDVR